MLKVGTYNAIIAPNEFYSPAASDFTSSHKTFKRMMPTFAWEVVEVYSGPPRVAFRWRHWGEMKNDYVGFNEFRDPASTFLSQLCRSLLMCRSKGEKITAKAHNGPIDIEGVTVAQVDDQVRLQKVETWFDPLEMFRQIAPNGIVNKEAREPHHVGDYTDQEEDRAAGSVETNAESNIAEKLTSTVQANAGIPQLQKTADSLPQLNTNEVSGALDLSAPNITQSKEKVEANSRDAGGQVETHNEVAMTENDKLSAKVNADPALPLYHADPIEASPSTRSKDKQQLTPGSKPVTTPDSDSKPHLMNLGDEDHPEVMEAKPRAVTHEVSQVPSPAADSLVAGLQPRSNDQTENAEPQLPSNVLLNQIPKTLESVQSDFRQLSSRAGDLETRLNKLEGVPTMLTETAPTPGSAVAANPESEETQRAHEEMSRISAGECPFLMNRE